MTDEAFNRYLRNRLHAQFPAWLDSDPRIELRDGRIVLDQVDYRLDDQDDVTVRIEPQRCAAQIEVGLREAVEELTRRSFER